MTDKEALNGTPERHDEIISNETTTDQMSESMSELVMSSSQHKVNGESAPKELSGTAKLESQPKEKLIQLIRKQLLIIKQERKASTDAKNETETLRQQLAELESKTQKGADSMLSLELSDYKKGMETLRKKCESADKELLEKDGMLKELGIKLHNLTERNVQLTDTVSEQRYEMDTQNAKIKELEDAKMNITNDFEQQHIDVQNRLEALIKENEEQSDTIKKLKKKLKTIRNTGADQKTELNQLQKSKDILQKNYDDLAADFAAYKEKAEFVLKQQSTDKQRVNENFEIEELQRQLKLKAEQINQLSERSVSYQQEINSAQERCRVLRSELEDARQSIQIAHKSASDERKRLALEYEQRIRQLTKELEDNKRDLIFVREHATNERQKMEEINARVVAELNNQIEDLQFKLTQLNADRNVNVTNETKQAPKEHKRSHIMNPINFDTETRFNMNDLANSNSIDKDDMINSLHDLINGSETIHPTNLNYQHSQSHDSLNSWDPEDLEGQLQHTRSVLRETEQTNAKLEAQVDLLKKELRRNESNSQSLQHINQNMSYFKNVMMKFLAPDEKVRDSRIQMLPVLGTMLALSSEEIKTIENALKAQDQERLAASSEIAGYFGPLSGIF